MSEELHPSDDPENAIDTDSLLDDLDAIEAALIGNADEDDRVGSGVPDTLRADEDAFLEMSGMAPKKAVEEAPAEPAAESTLDIRPEDGDEGDPINFYEEGVSDVDAIADEVSDADLPDIVVSDEPAAAATTPKHSLEDLREIIDDLSPDEAAALVDRGPSTESSAEQIPGMLEQVKSEILDEIKDDLSAINLAQFEAAARHQQTLDAISAQREAVDALIASAKFTPAPTAAPAPHEVAGPAPDPAAEIAEAERLIEEMQEQPRASDDLSEPIFDPIDLDAISNDVNAEPIILDEVDLNYDDVVEDDDEPRPMRSRRKKKGHRRRQFIRAMVLILLLCAAIGATWPYLNSAWFMIMPSLQSPNAAYAVAEDLLADGRPNRASTAFASFHQNYPLDPRAEQALLMAGYSLLSTPPNLGTEHFRRAIGYFDRFETTFPDSPKIARVQTLKAAAYMGLNQHEEAISTLTSDASILRQDTVGAVPALRVLAQAHAVRGDFDEAHNRLLQAVSMRGNFTVDEDYEALADLAVEQAAHTADEQKQTELLNEADRYIGEAIRSPYIEAARREFLEHRRGAIRDIQTQGVEATETGTMTQGESIPIDDTMPDPGPVSEPAIEEAPDVAEPAPVMDGPATPITEEAPPVAPDPVDDTAEEEDAEAPMIEEGLAPLPEAPVIPPEADTPAVEPAMPDAEPKTSEEAEAVEEVVEEPAPEPEVVEAPPAEPVEEEPETDTPAKIEPAQNKTPPIVPKEAAPATAVDAAPKKPAPKVEGSMTLDAPPPKRES